MVHSFRNPGLKAKALASWGQTVRGDPIDEGSRLKVGGEEKRAEELLRALAWIGIADAISNSLATVGCVRCAIGQLLTVTYNTAFIFKVLFLRSRVGQCRRSCVRRKYDEAFPFLESEGMWLFVVVKEWIYAGPRIYTRQKERGK
jgi:hypothetical protein